MIRSLVPLALLSLAGAAACGGDGTSPSSPPTSPPTTARNDTVAISVSAADAGPEIPANFMGLGVAAFDIEVSRTPNRAPTTALVNVLKSLGTGVMRVCACGLHSTEAWWTPGTVRLTRPDSATLLISRDFERLFQVLAAANWTAIVGVNLATAPPDTSAAEAAYLQALGGPVLEAIEIGNEPDLYAGQRLRPSPYNFVTYAADLATYVAAIRQRAPTVRIAAPSTVDTSWFRQAMGTPGYALATHHRYVLLNGAGVPTNNARYATLEHLLSDVVLKDELAIDRAIAANAARAGVPARLTELNTAELSGREGVSDVFASALWAIDYAFAAAEAGLAGINIFGYELRPGLPYSPFYLNDDGSLTPRPMLYGMLAFQDAARGSVLTLSPNNPLRWKVSAHGSASTDGSTVRIAVVNKDTASVPVKLVVPQAVSASVRRLTAGATATSLSATAGITYAGATVSAAGTFVPVDAESLTPTGGALTLTVPAASAAIIVIALR